MSERLEEALRRVAAEVERELERLLPPGGDAPRLADAMRYAALAAGKRVRPFLVRAFGDVLGVPPAASTRAGAAVELIHCYSLVHDDLPAMDDAALRRGKPSCHRAFDEATAVLAGDALQAAAFAALAADDWPAPGAQRAALVGGLARAAGLPGMCGGQMLDLEAERQTLDLAAVTRLQRLKTGALIAFAADAPCILADAPPAVRRAAAGYAADLGLAFQIKDDLLDVEGEVAATGKDGGRDAVAGKATFLTCLGREGARDRLEGLRARAGAQLDILGADATLLRHLVDFVIDRRA